ncbi:hypothetical protein GCM10023185_24560 [Hymenobacter saemangeumensis]|uniref:Uncharacterized protein n=1 Tax=Hymenobacter saemangeumensis TaxID=1084522 RepID=A0ABP8IHJ1_9BACT
MSADTEFPDFDEDALRRLWQATPEPAAPSSPELRRQLTGRRRRLLLQKAGSLLALVLAPPAMLWVYLTVHPGLLATLGLLLAGLAVMGAIARQLLTLRLLYTFPAQDSPPRYLARLRGHYQWQQQYGLRFYQGYVLLLNTGLALFFFDTNRAEPAWQWGLVAGMAVFSLLVIRRYSQRYAASEERALAQLLSGLQGFEEKD